MHMTKQRRTSGFTLVELLVVIAIIGLLINLLLPAVQQAREAARRLQCSNRIKQLALGIQNFESANRHLPAAGKYADPLEATIFKNSYRRIDLQSGTNTSWIVTLLPYLEEQPLYDQFDFELPITQNPLNPQEQQIASLMCPSDATGGRLFEYIEPEDGLTIRFGKANYAAYSNPFHVDAWFHPGAIWLYGIELRRVTDGTSKTIALAEIRSRDHTSDQRGAWALPWAGSSLLSFDMHPTSFPSVEDVEIDGPYRASDVSLGATQRPNGDYGDVLYACPEPEQALLDQMPCNTLWTGYISAAPRSLHPGGVNVAFLDGHVAFIVEEIDEYSMADMISVDDGNVVPNNF